MQPISSRKTVLSTLAGAALCVALPAQNAGQIPGVMTPPQAVAAPGVVTPPSNNNYGPNAHCLWAPSAFQNAFGSQNNIIPFSWTPIRYQQVFNGSNFKEKYLTNGLGLRQDDKFGTFTGGSVKLSMQMSLTTYTAATLTNTFATNHTSTPTQVVNATTVVLPNMGPPPTNPNTVLFSIPFDRPFLILAGANVLVDINQTGNSRNNAIFTYPLDADNTNTTTTRLFGTTATGTIGRNFGLVMCFSPAPPPKDVSGHLKGLTTRWVTRTSAGTTGIIATRYKHEWIQLHSRICGVSVTNFDFNTTTQDKYRVAVYLETTPTSNIPSPTAIYTSPSAIVGTNTVEITFPPVALPGDGRDLFLAIEHQTALVSPDGGWTRFTRGDSVPSATVGQVDRPGRRLGDNVVANTISLASDRILFTKVGTGAWASSTSPRQMWIEPLLDSSEAIAASAVATTNQREQPGRGTPPDGTIAGLLSGIHPDIDNHNAQTTPGARADRVGFCVESSCLCPGDIVVFVIGGGFIKPKTVLGVKGAFCLAPIGNQYIFPGSRVVPKDKNFVKFTTGVPRTFPRVDIYWQALTLRVVNRQLTIVGFTAASIQRL